MRSLNMYANSNWHDYRPSRHSTQEPSEVKRLTDRVAQLDCALEGHEERIAELEQTIQELKTLIGQIRILDT